MTSCCLGLCDDFLFFFFLVCFVVRKFFYCMIWIEVTLLYRKEGWFDCSLLTICSFFCVIWIDLFWIQGCDCGDGENVFFCGLFWLILVSWLFYENCAFCVWFWCWRWLIFFGISWWVWIFIIFHCLRDHDKHVVMECGVYFNKGIFVNIHVLNLDSGIFWQHWTK